MALVEPAVLSLQDVVPPGVGNRLLTQELFYDLLQKVKVDMPPCHPLHVAVELVGGCRTGASLLNLVDWADG